MIRFDLPGDEALMLGATAARFVADCYGLAKRAAMLAEPAEGLPAHWPTMAGLGWLAAPLPEAAGGLAMAPADLLPLIAALGAGLVLEPYGPAILGCGTALAAALPDAAAQLAPMLAGARIEVLADGSAGAVRATARGADWQLSGILPLVPGAAAAARLWVVADAPDGPMLFPVEAAEASVTPFRLLDGQAAARVALDGVPAAPAASGRTLVAALARAGDMALFGALAESTGVIDALHAATLGYVKLREQFGRPIGRFQAVQHRAAEMFVRREEARSMAQLAAEALGIADAGTRRRLLSAAKVKIADNARAILRDAVQLHGGMGVTDELAVGHMVKRLLVLAQTGGDRAGHLARFQTPG